MNDEPKISPNWNTLLASMTCLTSWMAAAPFAPFANNTNESAQLRLPPPPAPAPAPGEPEDDKSEGIFKKGSKFVNFLFIFG